ncbi:cob(I)yrinic acid a,c-diamide adenosyltransferase [Ningiella sp. W23]|uniref:cob(I)yrinic acid a,c-diamide adenosyltransferase n=1 Tax=Ningiella sp. W23 TaxID=3023715 RepID=UPI0037582333
MKIYTKQGDSGTTQVYAKQVLKVSKDDALIECYGSLDELNAHIGLLAVKAKQANMLTGGDRLGDDVVQLFQFIQRAIFSIGFAISDSATLDADSTTRLEKAIDEMQNKLAPQTKFILPGGHELAAQAHVARTVARRAERQLVTLSHHHDIDSTSMQFINRLSDYFFVFARWANHIHDENDIEV